MEVVLLYLLGNKQIIFTHIFIELTREMQILIILNKFAMKY